MARSSSQVKKINSCAVELQVLWKEKILTSYIKSSTGFHYQEFYPKVIIGTVDKVEQKGLDSVFISGMAYLTDKNELENVSAVATVEDEMAPLRYYIGGSIRNVSIF